MLPLNKAGAEAQLIHAMQTEDSAETGGHILLLRHGQAMLERV